MAENVVLGVERVFKKLDNLKFDTPTKRNIIRRVARKGGNVLKDRVRQLMPDQKAYKYTFHLRKSVKVRTSKSRNNPGVNVYTKGADVPFGKDFWNIGGYQALYFFGNYKSPGRYTKKGRKFRGEMRPGTGYNPFKVARLTKGRRALIIMSTGLRKEIRKEWNR